MSFLNVFIAVDAELVDFEDFFEPLSSSGDVDLKQSESGDCAVVIEDLFRAEDDSFFAVDAELADFEDFFERLCSAGDVDLEWFESGGCALVTVIEILEVDGIAIELIDVIAETFGSFSVESGNGCSVR